MNKGIVTVGSVYRSAVPEAFIKGAIGQVALQAEPAVVESAKRISVPRQQDFMIGLLLDGKERAVGSDGGIALVSEGFIHRTVGQHAAEED